MQNYISVSFKLYTFENQKERHEFLDRVAAEFPELNLRLTSFRMQFLFVSVVSTYLRFVTFSKFCYLALNLKLF
jgi:hypothetical protein